MMGWASLVSPEQLVLCPCIPVRSTNMIPDRQLHLMCCMESHNQMKCANISDLVMAICV